LVWWQCPRGHEYEMRVLNRKYGQKCPICSGRKVNSDNNLAALYPKLMEEWDYTRNHIDPTTIRPGSAKKAWWSCDKGHSWHTRIVDRAHKGTGCPECWKSKRRASRHSRRSEMQ
jgi:hypothetical protein